MLLSWLLLVLWCFTLISILPLHILLTFGRTNKLRSSIDVFFVVILTLVYVARSRTFILFSVVLHDLWLHWMIDFLAIDSRVYLVCLVLRRLLREEVLGEGPILSYYTGWVCLWTISFVNLEMITWRALRYILIISIWIRLLISDYILLI